MGKQIELSCVVPVYHGNDCRDELTKQIHVVLNKKERTQEQILADDCSQVRSRGKISSWQRQIHLVTAWICERILTRTMRLWRGRELCRDN